MHLFRLFFVIYLLGTSLAFCNVLKVRPMSDFDNLKAIHTYYDDLFENELKGTPLEKVQSIEKQVSRLKDLARQLFSPGKLNIEIQELKNFQTYTEQKYNLIDITKKKAHLESTSQKDLNDYFFDRRSGASLSQMLRNWRKVAGLETETEYFLGNSLGNGEMRDFRILPFMANHSHYYQVLEVLISATLEYISEKIPVLGTQTLNNSAQLSVDSNLKLLLTYSLVIEYFGNDVLSHIIDRDLYLRKWSGFSKSAFKENYFVPEQNVDMLSSLLFYKFFKKLDAKETERFHREYLESYTEIESHPEVSAKSIDLFIMQEIFPLLNNQIDIVELLSHPGRYRNLLTKLLSTYRFNGVPEISTNVNCQFQMIEGRKSE